MKEISRGAEAVIFLDKDKIVKQRLKKNYRIDILDKKLRISRTKKEINLLKKSSEIINVPKLISSDNDEILMEYLNGDKLSESFDNLNEIKREKVCFKIGEYLAKLHNKNIIHNDLTTANIITFFSEKSSAKKEIEIYFIDFGLGFISTKIEDKAYDLHILRQTLKSRHYNHYEKAFKIILKSYKEFNKEYKLIEERLNKIELRGRYKRKNKQSL